MSKFIELKEKGGRVQSFDYGHAVNLLSLKNTVWSIPTDSELEFSNNVITKRTDSNNTGGTTKKKVVRKRSKTSKSTKTS